jgi:uncharacterized protein YcfL
MRLKVLIVLLFVFLLTGCRSEEYSSNYKGDTMYFKTISKEVNGEVIYDTRTGVEYWRSASVYNCGNLTVLVDADGKPLVYNGSVDE